MALKTFSVRPCSDYASTTMVVVTCPNCALSFNVLEEPWREGHKLSLVTASTLGRPCPYCFKASYTA